MLRALAEGGEGLLCRALGERPGDLHKSRIQHLAKQMRELGSLWQFGTGKEVLCTSQHIHKVL